MKILSTDPDEPGIFAIGQVATGIFAFGQMATGVIAIGQLARGVIAVGQLAIGFVAIGQCCYAVCWGGGMFGLTGRGFGFVLKLLPKQRPDRGAPERWAACLPIELVRERGAGLVFARVQDHALVSEHGDPLGVELTPPAAATLAEAAHGLAIVAVSTHEHRESEGTYREAPQVSRTLSADTITLWQPWPWPFEAITGTGCAPWWQLGLRAIALVCAVVGWWFIAGESIAQMFQ